MAETTRNLTVTQSVSFYEETVWHFALRYALPRASTASTVVSRWLRQNLGKIREGTLHQMMAEIRNEVVAGRAGDQVDVSIWNQLATDIEGELHARSMTVRG